MAEDDRMPTAESADAADYKNRRGGDVDTFLKRFRETPEIIFGKNPTELAMRWYVYLESYLFILCEYVQMVFKTDEHTTHVYVLDFIAKIFRNGKIIKAPTWGWYRKILLKSIRRHVCERLAEEAKEQEEQASYVRSLCDRVEEQITYRIDLHNLRKGLEQGLVDDCLYGNGKIPQFSRQEIRCWKLRYLDALPRYLVAREVGFDETKVSHTVKEINRYLHEHAKEVLAALHAF